jgi:hypothetical protein
MRNQIITLFILLSLIGLSKVNAQVRTNINNNEKITVK